MGSCCSNINLSTSAGTKHVSVPSLSQQECADQLLNHQIEKEIVKYKSTETNVQSVSNITYKCIQSAAATQAGTLNNKNKINQDFFICIDSFGPSSTYQLYGICDGHGPDGHYVSKYVSDILPEIINKLLNKTDKLSPSSITAILKRSFAFIDNNLTKLKNRNQIDFDINFSGTTVTLGLFVGIKLYVANLGDSRTVLGAMPNNNKSVPMAIALSVDHNANNITEIERVQNSKHVKIISDRCNDKRILVEIPEIKEDTVQKMMCNVSRSVGDTMGHKYGALSSVPEITIHELSEKDIFVIFASDGIWEIMDNHDVMRVIGTKLKANKDVIIYDELQKATNKLVREANILWKDEYEQYADDITCVIARIGKAN